MRLHPYVFTGNDPRKGRRIPLNEIKYNEQRDEETSFGYCNEYQPHAVKRMFDYKNEMLYDMRWDEAGNLGQVSIAKPGEMFEAGRFLFWTEDCCGPRPCGANRMHTAVDDKYYSYYAYDHSGGSCASREQSQACLSYAEMEQRRRSQRRLKLTGDNKLLDVNADFMATYTLLNEPTLYPSAYMVLTNKGYTKHYYAGTVRVAARLGGGGLDVIGNDEELQTKADMLFEQSIEQVNSRVLHENDLDCIMGSEFAKEEFGHWIDGIPHQMKAEVKCDHGLFKEMVHSMLDDPNNGHEKEVYFYHSDHLGSASWITDFEGIAIQHLQYLPFGQPFVNQHPDRYQERFTFTGKERDAETGYGYFGARYMDFDLLTSFISVDRYADKYPFISPYAYCAWNPIKLTDPTGDTIVITGNPELVEKAIIQIRERSSNLYFSLDDGGRLKAAQRGNKELTEEETYMLGIINSAEVNINLRVQDNDHIAKGYEIGKGGGAYCGNTLRINNEGEVVGSTALQAININTMSKLDKLSWSTGELIWHEISEAYEGGLIAINNRMSSPPSNKSGTTYYDAHCAANRHFLGDIATDNVENPTIATMAILYNKCERRKQ